MSSTTPYSNSPTATPGGSFKRNALFAAGGAALLAVGLAAGLSLRSAPSNTVAEPVVAPVAQTAPMPAPAKPPVAMLANDGAVPPAPVVQAQQPAPLPAPRPAPRVERAAQAAPEPVHAAAVCSRCGTIEAVNAVKVKGSGSGVGAVAGGVVGGALGNQMGHGNGKAAMTILGALGGGFAGNEVEKHVKAATVYDVRVRMQDGSLRTVRQQTAPAIGERVLVEGNSLRADQRGG